MQDDFPIHGKYSPLRNAKPIAEWTEVQRMRLNAWRILSNNRPAEMMPNFDARAILGLKRLPASKKKPPIPGRASTAPIQKPNNQVRNEP